jgi:hypothetical protein
MSEKVGAGVEICQNMYGSITRLPSVKPQMCSWLRLVMANRALIESTYSIHECSSIFGWNAMRGHGQKTPELAPHSGPRPRLLARDANGPGNPSSSASDRMKQWYHNKPER